MTDHNDSTHEWRTSTFSDGLQCVEVAALDDEVLVRNSKDPSGPTLRFPRQVIGAFLAGAKAGEFDDLALMRRGGGK